MLALGVATSFTLASGLAQALSRLGLAVSSDDTHGLGPFFLIPLDGVRSCDSCVPWSSVWGLQPASHQGTEGGGAEAVAAQTQSVQGVRMTRVRAWWLQSPDVTGGSPEGPTCCW